MSDAAPHIAVIRSYHASLSRMLAVRDRIAISINAAAAFPDGEVIMRATFSGGTIELAVMKDWLLDRLRADLTAAEAAIHAHIATPITTPGELH